MNTFFQVITKLNKKDHIVVFFILLFATLIGFAAGIKLGELFRLESSGVLKAILMLFCMFGAPPILLSLYLAKRQKDSKSFFSFLILLYFEIFIIYILYLVFVFIPIAQVFERLQAY